MGTEEVHFSRCIDFNRTWRYGNQGLPDGQVHADEPDWLSRYAFKGSYLLNEAGQPDEHDELAGFERRDWIRSSDVQIAAARHGP